VKGLERTGDEAGGTGTCAVFFHRVQGGGFEDGVGGEAEVIVGGEIKKFAVADPDTLALGGVYAAQFAEQVLFAGLCQALAQFI